MDVKIRLTPMPLNSFLYSVVSKYIKTDTISRSMLDDLNIGNGDYPCGKQKITGEENGINCTPEYKYHSQMFNVVVPRNDQDED